MKKINLLIIICFFPFLISGQAFIRGTIGGGSPTIQETDPTVPSSLKDGVDFSEITGTGTITSTLGTALQPTDTLSFVATKGDLLGLGGGGLANPLTEALDASNEQINNVGWVRFFNPFAPTTAGWTLFHDSNGFNFTKGATNYNLSESTISLGSHLINKDHFDNNQNIGQGFILNEGTTGNSHTISRFSDIIWFNSDHFDISSGLTNVDLDASLVAQINSKTEYITLPSMADNIYDSNTGKYIFTDADIFQLADPTDGRTFVITINTGTGNAQIVTSNASNLFIDNVLHTSPLPNLFQGAGTTWTYSYQAASNTYFVSK